MSTQTELAKPVATSVLTYREAINAALEDALADDPSVVFFGEDIANAGGIWKTSTELPERFGADRVWNTPICENGFVGVALGMGITGLRPIVEIMFADFLPTAADAILNELPKYRFMSGGQFKAPVTIRAVGGAGGRFGTQHSATGESWFLQVPGLRLAAAGSPSTAYGLLRAAVRDDNPTIVFEHKTLFARKGEVERGEQGVMEIGRAATLREGDDVTIVATLAMVERALEAAAALADDGVEAEVIDLRWLRPLDFDSVRASVERTGRIVVVEEQYHHGGWGASLISRLTMDGVEWTSLPRAVAFPDELPIAYSPPLEDEIMPSVETIAAAVRASVDGEVGR